MNKRQINLRNDNRGNEQKITMIRNKLFAAATTQLQRTSNKLEVKKIKAKTHTNAKKLLFNDESTLKNILQEFHSDWKRVKYYKEQENITSKEKHLYG